MSGTRVFVCFDVEHDEDLYQQLLAQSKASISSFDVTGASERSISMDLGGEKVRRRIREADQVIVICSEHTESSMRVSAELRIAQEEQIPYFLLWGRREIMCTKPIGAKTSDGMYSWTREVVQDQITFTHRKGIADAAAELGREAARKSGSSPPRPAE